MPETLDSTNGSQCQLLDVSVLSFRIQKVAAEVIYDVLIFIIVILHENHADSGVGGGQI